MKIADVVIRIDKTGLDVHRSGVTPAELLILVSEHHTNAGGDPVQSLTEKGEVVRTDSEELDRLRTRFQHGKVKAAYQGAIPTLPKTFEEARKAGIGMVMPRGSLVQHQLL
jgi:hypothetical protein